MSAPELPNAKATLRTRVRAAVGKLPPAARIALSAQACARLAEQTVWREAKRILCFAPLPDEPDILPLLGQALRDGRIVALPRFSDATRTYTAARIRDLQTDIRPGKFGIHEPHAGCEELPMDSFELVLVPGVAFDQHG